MTVLHPWPQPAVLAAGQPAGALGGAPHTPGWRTLRPAGVPLKASVAALPPCGAAPHGTAGQRPLELSPLNKLRPVIARQALSLRAGMAELVLLNRLRARTRRDVTVEVLEHAARVIEVSARSWLAEDGSATR